MIPKHFVFKKVFSFICFAHLFYGISGKNYSFEEDEKKFPIDEILTSAKQAIKVFKRKPKYVDEINSILEFAANEISKTTKDLSKYVPDQKIAICEESLNQSFQNIRNFCEQEGEAFNSLLEKEFGKKKLKYIEKKLKLCLNKMTERIKTKKTSALFNQLSNDLQPAIATSEEALYNLNEKLNQFDFVRTIRQRTSAIKIPRGSWSNKYRLP